DVLLSKFQGTKLTQVLERDLNFARSSTGGEDGSPPITQAMHFSEKLAPDTDYLLVSVALRLMGVAASALETGQFTLASCASFWKVSSSMPGTTASVSRSMGLMAKPPGTGLKWTRAVVCTLVGVKPALASAFDSAIEKQPACAAPMSSSGLVPTVSSPMRDLNE